MRTILSGLFGLCVVGFLASSSCHNRDVPGTFVVLGLVTLMLLGMAQRLAEWLGIDQRVRSQRSTAEYFVDEARNILASRPYHGPRRVGEVVELDGQPRTIVDAHIDDDGDYIFVVR